MPEEYISREAAIKYAEHAYHEWNLAMAAADGKREINLVYKRQELCKAVESVFRDMPAADVAEVGHGQWVLHHTAAGKPYTECSNCCTDFKFRTDKGTLAKLDMRSMLYCPHCGARMDGGDDRATD